MPAPATNRPEMVAEMVVEAAVAAEQEEEAAEEAAVAMAVFRFSILQDTATGAHCSKQIQNGEFQTNIPVAGSLF
jgi:hypothetical protein